jgi:hypothetical protein
MEGMMSTSLYFVTEGEVEVFSSADDPHGDEAATDDSQGDRSLPSPAPSADVTGIAANEHGNSEVNTAVSQKAPKVPAPAKVEEAAKPNEQKHKTAAELNAELGIVGTAKPKPVEAVPEPEQPTDAPAPDEEEKILGTYPYGGTFGEAAFVLQIYHPYSLRARWTIDV